jgi:hypothetical protein
MKLKWAWILGFGAMAVATVLVVFEHLNLEQPTTRDWVIPAFQNFNYPAFVVAPWIVEHLPFITHGDVGPNMTEVYLCDGFYILISGIGWFLLGAIIIFVIRKLRGQRTSSSFTN